MSTADVIHTEPRDQLPSTLPKSREDIAPVSNEHKDQSCVQKGKHSKYNFVHKPKFFKYNIDIK